ncbi:MAG: hypothetical protein KF744_15125 [Taibaiella sp.]|nr:hypothetical protein [Taibaiella sp.]
MKFILAAVLAIHAVAHLPGFLEAFGISKMPMSRPVSPSAGLIWLIVCVLLFAAAVLVVLGKGWGPYGLIAVVLSQLLVVIWWHDARLGTALNIAILVPALLNTAALRFKAVARNEAASILQMDSTVIARTSVADLPAPVAKWLKASGALNKTPPRTLRLRQKGKMRMEPDGKWLKVEAEQYFNAERPAFLWLANIRSPLYSVAGKDLFLAGKGNMVIKLASLLPVANASGPELDQGTMLRYLAEIQWFPGAALNEYVKWRQVGENAAEATLTYGGKSVTGTYFFNDKGDVISFEARRYMERKGTYTLETWAVPVTAYATFDGVRVPSRGCAIWKLKEGDFNWFRWEVTEIEFNPVSVY